MPWTLYRYILWELVKLTVVACVVLVTVISVFAAIKPLSEGLLSPVSMVKFVAFTAPTMLGFALPFSAAFASTLVFVRMVSDRELVACSSSGMSYGMILLPVVVLGLALGAGMFALSNLVVPAFYRQAEQTLQRDVMSVLVNRLNRNEPFELGGMVLYADSAVEAEPPALADSPLEPIRLIQLRGVAVGERDDTGELRSETTASAANVLLFRDPATRQSWITVRVRDVVYSRQGLGQGDLFAADRLDPWALRLPSPLRDSTKFMSWPELRDLGEQPASYDDVAEHRDELARAMAVWELRRKIVNPLQAGESVKLRGPLQRDLFSITAPRVAVEGDQLLLYGDESGPVEVVELREGTDPRRRIEAEMVRMRITAEPPAPEPTVDVEAFRSRVVDVRRGTTTEHEALPLPSMSWPEPILATEYLRKAPAELRDRARSLARSDPWPAAVGRSLERLSDSVRKLATRIGAELHSRAASALAAGLVLLLGATTSLHHRGAMPLVVYFRVFMAAVLAVLLVAGGENLAIAGQVGYASSLGVLWLGNTLLLIGVGWSFFAASRR
ncbi:MAG: LptF/LptG family permease [Phycisphaeraceae bacterium]